MPKSLEKGNFLITFEENSSSCNNPMDVMWIIHWQTVLEIS